MRQISLLRAIIVLLLCVSLSGCAMPLLIVPVVGTGLFGSLFIGILSADQMGPLIPLLYPATLYLGLMTAVLWIVCAEKVAASLESTSNNAPRSIYRASMEQSAASGLAVLLVLAYVTDMTGSATEAAMCFLFTFLYVLLITMQARILKSRANSLSQRIDAIEVRFPDHVHHMSGIQSYGKSLEGMHKVQGAGYFAFLVPPLILIPYSYFGHGAPYTVVELVGFGTLCFGLVSVGYVVWRSFALAESSKLELGVTETYEDVFDYFQEVHEARTIIFEDRVHTIIVAVVSVMIGFHLFLDTSLSWAVLGAQSAALMGGLVVLVCWVPFYLHQDGSKRELMEQIATNGNRTPAKLREIKQTLDSLCPSIPRMQVIQSLAAALGLGGFVSALTTIGKSLG